MGFSGFPSGAGLEMGCWIDTAGMDLSFDCLSAWV